MSTPFSINQMQAMANPESLTKLDEGARQALVESIFQRISQLGIASYEQGQYDRAKEIFEELIHIAPESAYAHAALGTVLTKLGENETALTHLNRALELDATEISAWVNRAEVYLRLHRDEEAVSDLQQAIALNPAGDSPVAQRASYILKTLMTRLQLENSMPPSPPEIQSAEPETNGGFLRSLLSKLGKKI